MTKHCEAMQMRNCIEPFELSESLKLNRGDSGEVEELQASHAIIIVEDHSIESGRL